MSLDRNAVRRENDADQTDLNLNAVLTEQRSEHYNSASSTEQSQEQQPHRLLDDATSSLLDEYLSSVRPRSGLSARLDGLTNKAERGFQTELLTVARYAGENKVLAALPAVETTDAASKPAEKEKRAESAVKYQERDKAELEEGSYERDSQGRITSITSADGKTKHAFKYEDASNPNRITSDTVDGKTYKFIGPVTVEGKPYINEGFEVNSFSIYDEKNNLIGNWAGIRSISKNGVYSVRESGDNAPITHVDAGGNKLTEQQRAQKDHDGIWPATVDVLYSDGSKFHAELVGKLLQGLEETVTENGKEKTIKWSRSGDSWTSDENPSRERRFLNVLKNGDLKFEQTDGTKFVIHSDSTRDVTASGITRTYDAENKITAVTHQNGDSRKLTYENGKLVSFVDETKYGKTEWTKKAGSDQWQNGSTKEVRKEVTVLADGSIEYKSEKGRLFSQTKDFATVEFDDKKRPQEVRFSTGSTRHFDYDGDKLKSITDSVKQNDKTTTKTWTREKDTDNFVSTSDAGKKRTRSIKEAPTAEGDYKYTNADMKERTARAADIERLARGEIMGGSENVQEAREDFVDACKSKKIDVDRVEKYLKDVEKNGVKYSWTPEQMSKTLDNLRTILTSDAKSPIYTDDQRKTIVETALHNIARPMEIDQGYHPTCNVTTIEVYAAARHPDEYTRMCKEIALTGKYKTTSDGRTVTPPEAALKPGEDEKSYDLDKPNVEKRNLASEIIEMTLVNAAYELDGVKAKGQVVKDTRYILDKVKWVDSGPGSKRKVGEDRLVDLQGKPKKDDDDGGPGFTESEIAFASNLMFGYEMPYVHGPRSIDDGQTWTYDLPTADRLLKAKKDNQLPLGVPTMGGEHVQTIHDVFVDKKGTCWILLDNQHGAKKDGWVTLDDLHKTQQTKHLELEPSIPPNKRPED